MSRAEDQFRAELRKLAKLLRKREKILDKIIDVEAEESALEWSTARAIENFLAQR